MSDNLPKIGVLISGRGSNLHALMRAATQGALHAQISIVISNNPDAAGLAHARAAGVEAIALSHRDRRAFPTREAYDRALARELTSRGVQLVCLAGFMRLLSQPFLDAFPNAVLNVHPSLLPAFPGVNAQYQAWAHGVKWSGATVHLVTAELDGGPVVLQEPVPVRDDDTAESLAERILEVEHRIYPAAAQLVLKGSWRLEGRRFVGV